MTTPRPPRRRALSALSVVAAGATALALALALTGAQSATASASTSYPDARPSWAKHADEQGKAAADTTVEGEIGFSLRDRSGAE